MTREEIDRERRNLQGAGLQDSRSGEDRGPLQQRVAGSRCGTRTWCGCARTTRWRAFWSATISPSATKTASRFRCTSCSIRWRRATIRWRCKCDVEMGGTDQKFNLLVGREIAEGFRAAAADRRHHAAARRHRRRQQDVEVARQLHRHHRAARGHVPQGDADLRRA